LFLGSSGQANVNTVRVKLRGKMRRFA
jgi:hypothetical protein